MMNMRKLFIVLLFLPSFTIAQKKQITIQDIHEKRLFRNEVVPGFAKEAVTDYVSESDVKDEKGQVIVLDEVDDDYLVSENKKKILYYIDKEYIYRRSYKATVYLHNIESKKTILLSKDKVLHAT